MFENNSFKFESKSFISYFKASIAAKEKLYNEKYLENKEKQKLEKDAIQKLIDAEKEKFDTQKAKVESEVQNYKMTEDENEQVQENKLLTIEKQKKII